MARNYKKEREWKVKKYYEIHACIDRELGLKLKEKLNKENKSIASWITDNAENYTID